ncbi:MAG: hypothetical protein J0I41_00140 [Filimonas sp.]|nr:hypothetical protein [Filimonas sp.]
MALNVTKVQDYIKPISQELATKAVVEAKTAKLLIENKAMQAGIKGKASILKMEADVNLQDGSGCGRNPGGNSILSNKDIVVTALKDEQNFCSKTLYNSYFVEAVAQGQDPESETLAPAFIKNIMENRAKKINLSVENLLWHGDTALTGTNPLKWIDGIVKQVKAGSYNDLSAVTGSTIVEKLQYVYLNTPVEVRMQDDFRIFVGEDMYADYLVALSNKNIFKPTDDFTLFGTTAKLFPTPGLNASKEIVAARISNFHLGLDGEAETDNATLRFSIETNQWYQDFHFAVGIAVIFPEQVGYVKLT